MGLATVPDLWSIYAASGASTLIWTAVFGFGWGTSVVLYGLGYTIVGMSLTSAIILGSSVAIGSLGALFLLEPHRLVSASGLPIVGADLLMLAGVLLCARAGGMREKAQASAVRRSRDPHFRRGIMMCFAAGILSTLFNIALANGRPITEQALARGIDPLRAANAVWSLAISAGSVPNLLWAVMKLKQTRAWGVYRVGASTRNFILCVVMAGLWITGTVLYGGATNVLGKLGPVVGWPMYMSGMILTNNFWGWMTAEWKGVHGWPVRVMFAGIFIQLLAMVWLSQV
jgi:L-rhamnose-H+ transport protein